MANLDTVLKTAEQAGLDVKICEEGVNACFAELRLGNRLGEIVREVKHGVSYAPARGQGGTPELARSDLSAKLTTRWA